MTAREILLAAADHLERYGWVKNMRGGPGAPCCTVGAIAVACNNDEPLYSEACQVLREHLNVRRLTDWNDTRSRTADEVITAMRAAAECAS